MDKGYFIIDGSHLFSSIHELHRTKSSEGFSGKKLDISKLTEALMRRWSLNVGVTIRTIYYFKKNDKRISTMLEIPEIGVPGVKNHWQTKECGESIDAVPDDELQKLSPQYRDHFARAEKGLDIKLTCDVLQLVSSGKASNIVFLVNDRDYIPLFEAIQNLGGNVYLTSLHKDLKIQTGLLKLADHYLTLENEIRDIFNITDQPPVIPTQEIEQVTQGVEVIDA